jgi:hypothetical protein
VSWSSVESFCAATVGKVVFGRSATTGLIRSASWPTALAMMNESDQLEAYPSSV